MDIETTGVKICIPRSCMHFSSIKPALHRECTIFVEPENSEDAKLITDDLNGINEIEIQVKGSQESVTPTNLAQHLAHFPKGKQRTVFMTV